jgi:hypothetical protein
MKRGNSMFGYEFGDGVRTGIGVLNHKVKLPLKDIWFKSFEVEMFEGFKESWVCEFGGLVLLDCCVWFGHKKIQGQGIRISREVRAASSKMLVKLNPNFEISPINRRICRSFESLRFASDGINV